MVKIKILEKPTLPKVKMLCDEVIDERLLKYPMIEACWSMNSFNVICAKMGQGKTSLVTSLVKTVFKKCFETIYVMIPPNSRASIDNDVFGKNLKPDQLYDTLDEQGLQEIYANLQKNSSENYNSLLIIDDFQAQLKDLDIVKTLQKIITKMRHLRCTIFLLQQNFQALPKSLRELITNLIVFDVGKSQLTKIFNECMPIDKEKFVDVVNLAYQNKHDWICINFKHNKLFHKFDEIILENDTFSNSSDGEI